jgi:hypothetical protein
VIISGVWTPSIRPGGARWVGCTSGEEILSMLEVISSTRLFTNFGATCIVVSRRKRLERDIKALLLARRDRSSRGTDPVYHSIIGR